MVEWHILQHNTGESIEWNISEERPSMEVMFYKNSVIMISFSEDDWKIDHTENMIIW